MKNSLQGSKVLLGSILTAAVLFCGCGSSRENFVFTGTNPNPIVGLSPVAVDDAFNALGNATVNQSAANGVLANDTANGGIITAFDAVGSQGGTIVLNNDGSFSYTPVFGFVGAETFTYTLSNPVADSTATVTMTSTGSGFFVDNTVAPGGNGSQASPFNTLAAALAAANAGDTVVVLRGDGTGTGLAGPINLPAGVDLIGEGAGLVLAQTIVPQGQAPLLTGPITCNGSNTVSGFIIDGSATDGVIINGVGNVAVTDNIFRNSTEEHIDADNVTGTVIIEANTFESVNGRNGILINNNNTNSTLRVLGNTFQDNNANNPGDACRIDLSGTSQTTIAADNNVITGGTFGTSWDRGIQLGAVGTTVTTGSISGNQINNCDINGLSMDTESDAEVTLTMANNVSNNAGFQGFEIDVDDTSTLRLTLNGNTFNNNGDDGINLDTSNSATCTFIATGNTLNNNGDGGFALDVNDTATNNIALRNNNATGNGNGILGEDILISSSATASTVCADITGNTAEEVVLERGAGSTMNIERLEAPQGGPLEDVNTFTTLNVLGNPTSVIAGFCNLP